MGSLLHSQIARPTRRQLVFSALRVLAVMAAMLVVYAVLPVTPNSKAGNWLILAVGLFLFCAVLAWQVLAVLHSNRPVGRALEALCICLSLYWVIFATQYLAESLETSSAFTQPLDKLASFYYTITVFATVGFGDIAPVSDVARIITTIQMIGNIIVLGLGVRLLTGLAQDRLRTQRSEAENRPSPADG